MGLTVIADKIDAQIRAAQMGQARRELALALGKRVPRELRIRFANLAWRASLPLAGLRLLNPLVRPPPKSRVEATPQECLEYGACLTKIGAAEEALKLLKKIPASQFPTTLLYQVFARVSRWDYAPTVALLREYMELVRAEPYQVVVAKVNLIYAHLFLQDHEPADRLIAEVHSYASAHGMHLVLGKALELSCQSQLFRGDHTGARKSIKAARDVLVEDSLDGFFVRKLEQALRLESDSAALESIRAEARSRGHWETLRDCDRMEGFFLGSTESLLRVYFGTPYPSYREQLVRLTPEFSVPDHYTWLPLGKQAPVRLDLLSGKIGAVDLPPGKLLHQMLRILGSDFYRPIRLATLFHQLHPEEFFHPETSPPRIYDLIARFREQLTLAKVPVVLEETGGEYSLRFSAPCRVEVALQYGVEDLLRLNQLQGCFGEAPFSAGEAARVLDFPLRTTQRFCRDQLEQGRLRREGSGKATRYFVTPKAS